MEVRQGKSKLTPYSSWFRYNILLGKNCISPNIIKLIESLFLNNNHGAYQLKSTHKQETYGSINFLYLWLINPAANNIASPIRNHSLEATDIVVASARLNPMKLR